MSVRFALPDVGEGLHEAEIVRWLVVPGETVARDQPLVEILTDKAQVELPSPAAGVVRTLAVAEGTVVPVGTVLIEIDDGSPAPPPPLTRPSPSVPNQSRVAVSTDPANGRIDVDSALRFSALTRPKASPSTRRLAASLGVDLASVTGSGPGGRILATDVESATAAAPTVAAVATSHPGSAHAASLDPSPTGPGTPSTAAQDAPARAAAGSTLGQLAAGTHPLRGIRRLTAASMTQSWTTIPHITGMDEVDATALLDARARLRQALREDGDEVGAAALTPLVLLAAAVARTLRRYPLVNAAVTEDGLSVIVYPDVNLGVAVATDNGLMVPVVRHADRRSLRDLAVEMARLGGAARDRRITAAELRGGTFTLTNYGALGGRFATPLILPGQAGIMGFGAIRDRPLVIEGQVVARPTLPVVFSADHRIIDGDLSVAFQEHVLALVADPLRLLLGA
ncbi:MAG: dihydrolipoamide acetyltransferase family protein [Acidimicrobiales bacterium]